MLSNACPKPIKGMHIYSRRKNNTDRLQDAYAIVNVRDENESRVSGCHLIGASADNRQRREHHHLRGRNVRPDWKYDPRRIMLCSAFEHGLLESGAILVEGDDADQRLVFTWNRELVKPGEEPLRIKSKRWSQNADRSGNHDHDARK